MRPYWVGHSCMTSAHFSPPACFGLWLITSLQVDCVSLTAVLILDTSGINNFFNLKLNHQKRYIPLARVNLAGNQSSRSTERLNHWDTACWPETFKTDPSLIIWLLLRHRVLDWSIVDPRFPRFPQRGGHQPTTWPIFFRQLRENEEMLAGGEPPWFVNADNADVVRIKSY